MKNIINEEKRLQSLDIFRGIAIAGMIIVNNQGDWSHVYIAFRHAASFLYSLCFLVFWVGVMYILYRKQIFIKI